MPPDNITLLVADDDLHIRGLLRRALEHEGYRVVEAADGRQALAILAEENPALVLLDVRLPGTDGITVCQRIRQRCQTPIIMITAVGSKDLEARALDLGADDYVIKPFSIKELVARVKAVLRRTLNGRRASPATPLAG